MTVSTTARPVRYTPTRPFGGRSSFGRHAVPQRGRHARHVHPEGEARDHRAGIDAEIIVADNGSTDGSQDIAERHGARVVPVDESRLWRRAHGRHRRRARAFHHHGRRRRQLRLRRDSRASSRSCARGTSWSRDAALPSRRRHGRPSAMRCCTAGGATRCSPPSPARFARRFTTFTAGCAASRATVHEARAALLRDGVRLGDDHKATFRGARIAEVPITLHPDGRTAHPPHLKTFRDGWRHRASCCCTARAGCS